MTHQQKAEHHANKIKAHAFELSQKLGSTPGFINYWFKILPKCSSHKAAFEIADLLHTKIFGVEKFSNFESFKTYKNRLFKKRNAG